MDANVFVDCHCHLFNIVDIPLYATLDDQVQMGTLKRLIAAFGAGHALLSGVLGSKLEEYEDMVRFFERSIPDNIRWLAGQVKEAVDAKTILLTPLVMDFDVINDSSLDPEAPFPPSSDTGEPTVFDQYRRLKRAITSAKKTLAGDDGRTVLVCPFVGFDLRKLVSVGEPALKALQKVWDTHGLPLTERKKGTSALTQGALLGIKLYPPIGFNPHPPDQAYRDAYRPFYEWCVAEQIPLTVHCQPASYSTGSTGREIYNRTHARNWLALLEGNPDLASLRINFAHFGGESEMEDMIDYFRADDIDEDTWTYTLVRLLQGFPNTYADISAYDYSDSGARSNLAKALEKDHVGTLGVDRQKLATRLLWGSDVPMIISGRSYRKDWHKKGETAYQHLFAGFGKTVYQIDEASPQEKRQLITNLTCINPQKFLFGG